ncbi:esterase E4-like [Rhynchophorus ferrugineus]|uniref:esterase E4-like n=1 Tax=Rhynchophorus ferrugineus TaxID=354439 RepID=UPI003FCE92E2
MVLTNFRKINGCLVSLSLFFILHGVNSLGFVPHNQLNKQLQVTLPNGVIQGQKETSLFGKTFFSYLGVPYAQPPINDLRFQEPQPVRKWFGVLDGTVEGPFCSGVNISAMVNMDLKSQGQEDCLYLNIFTPKSPKDNDTDSLPVLIYYYGGAFLGGGPIRKYYSPDYLIDNDIIVILPHFRTAVFGYLSTEDLNCPGNWGLKDQIAVLKWANQNIKFFGGDPNQVTIAGQSAGAVSVNSILLSPKAKGLFQRAIIMSGGSLCFWGYQTNSKKIAFDIGVALGIETNDTKHLVNELRRVKSEDLMHAQILVMLVNFAETLTNGLPYTPTIEPYHEGAVLTEFPFNQLKRGNFNRVPILTGVTSMEMILFQKVADLVRPILSVFDLSPGLFVRLTKNSQNRSIVGKKIKQLFFDNANFASLSDLELMTFLSDDVYWRPARKMAELVSRYSPVYFYKFMYEGELGLTTNTRFNGLTTRAYTGVGHTEDTYYLFERPEYKRNQDDTYMSKKLSKIFTNFVKNGNPTPVKDPLLDNISWPRVTKQQFPYVEINRRLKVVSENFNEKRYRIWEYLYQTYGDKPYKVY